MMDRLLAEQQQALIEALLATNERVLEDQQVSAFMQEIDRRIAGGEREPVVPQAPRLMSLGQMAQRPGLTVVTRDDVGPGKLLPAGIKPENFNEWRRQQRAAKQQAGREVNTDG
jgi:hypothetical protein